MSAELTRAAPVDATVARQRWTLFVVCVGVLMLLVDTTIVSVALPSISRSLKPSFSELQWVINAYALTLAVLLLTAGALSDIVGRRRIFAIGLVVFTTMSLVCALAWSPVALDVGRALQGVGGAMMLATSLALLAQEFPPAERAGAFAIWGGTTTLALAIGPVVGGALTSWLGWRSVFFVNVPIGVVLLLVTLTRLVNRPGPPASVDVGGLLTFSAGMFTLVFALIRGNDEGWASATIIGLLVASAVFLAAFVYTESRVAAPMVDLSLFRKPTFLGAAAAAFTLMVGVGSLILYITLWFQTVLGYSPLQAGLRGFAISGSSFAAAIAGGRLFRRLPFRYPLATGLLLVAVGDFVMHRVSATSGWTALLPGMVVAGAGLGLAAAPLAASAVGVVPPVKSGMASGINSTFRQLGLAVGLASLGAIFQHSVRIQVAHVLASTPVAPLSRTFANLISSGGAQRLEAASPPVGRPIVHHAAQLGVTSGLRDIFLVAGAVALAGALTALALVRPKDLFVMPAGGGPPGGGPPGAHPPARG